MANGRGMNVLRQKILVFDSGLGGLTIFRAIRALRPDADYLYIGDTERFPYGDLASEVLIARVEVVIGDAIANFAADCIVVACNTAATIVLPGLRARYAIPVVGTVPAIKPAAMITQSGLISVLATPGTVRRDYTRELIREFAGGADVTLVGSAELAGLAEQALRGEVVGDAEILAEISPAFVAREGRQTDTIVLACTHYPLLLTRFEMLAPWPVIWIDPAPAIARRVVQTLGDNQAGGIGDTGFILTSGECLPTGAVIDGIIGLL